MKFIFTTNNSFAPTLARLTLGIVMFPHGAQKALGLFGGYGFQGTLNWFTQQLHIPTVFAVLAIAAEFLGSLGLITGFLSRIAAFGIAVTMMVAVVTVHGVNGFFINWFGNQKGEGFEFHLLAIGLALIVMIYGAGKLSLDAQFARKTAKQTQLQSLSSTKRERPFTGVTP
jgi:putative oxidoreductase